MRALVLATLLTTSAFAACPNLSGKYKVCKSQTGQMPASYDFQVIQRDSSGVQIYHIMSVDEAQEKTVDTFKADGKLYEQEMSDPASGMKFYYSSITKCEGDSLQITNKILNESLVVTMTKQGNKLIQKVSGLNLGRNILDTIKCE